MKHLHRITLFLGFAALTALSSAWLVNDNFSGGIRKTEIRKTLGLGEHEFQELAKTGAFEFDYRERATYTIPCYRHVGNVHYYMEWSGISTMHNILSYVPRSPQENPKHVEAYLFDGVKGRYPESGNPCPFGWEPLSDVPFDYSMEPGALFVNGVPVR